MTEVIMPKMGDAMEEGTLLEWLKAEGDAVKSGEVIGTIQTDKATLELESPGSGTLAGLLVQAGETVPVGRAIAAVLKAGEGLPAGWGNGQTAPVAAPAPKEVAAEPAAAAISAPSGARVKASPLAKKIAAERGIDLSTLRGTGPEGRIVEKDIPTSAPKASPQPAAPVAVAAEDRRVPLSRLRQITAQRTAQSMAEAPHFYVTVQVDVEAIQALRAQFEADESGNVSINDFVIKACAMALAQMPGINATYAGNEVVEHGAVHIGIAAAVEDGLTVPVLHNAHTLTLRQIATQSRDLATRARDNKLSLDELTGSTFSISNMGMLGVDSFTAIINTPNSAILAVSAAKKIAVVMDDGSLAARTRMNMTASFDHRVIDGAVGARFLNLVRDLLEHPTRLVS